MTMPSPDDLTRAKRRLRAFEDAFEGVHPRDLKAKLAEHVTPDYRWYGTHPFRDTLDLDGVVEGFWTPFLHAFRHAQRRPAIVFSSVASETPEETWVASTGQILGMFEAPWLDVPDTGKLTFVSSCEFHRLENDRIAETYHFLDVIAVMQQAGVDGLPPQTGSPIAFLPPRTQDGLQDGAPADPADSASMLALMTKLGDDLGANPEVDMDPDVLREVWHEDMLWWGPAGIGSTLGLQGFKDHHQKPYRHSLYDERTFTGHRASFAEGDYGGWVGWPSLEERVTKGGFLGMPATHTLATQRVVDIYRRERGKMAENWVFIDLLDYLWQLDVDPLGRMREMQRRRR
jgi:hypothetical protein